MNRLILKVFCLLSVASACAQTNLDLATTTVSNEPILATQTNESADTDALRAYLEVQVQLRATQLALEHNQQEAKAAAARNAQDLTDRLQQIEKSMTDQRNRDLQAMQSNNHVILIVAGMFSGIGFLAMLFTAYFHWRGVARLSEMSLSMTPGSMTSHWAVQSFNDPNVGSPIEPTGRLLNVIDRLEKRILQIEHTTRAPVQDASPTHEAASPSTAAASPEDAARITLLLGKGQSLLNLDKSEEAVACFDEVLTLDQNNTDALVKKGVALERLRKLNEAIECYDKAIAADSSVTIAYLYKGGVFNRLERFDEALQCYEQALRLQESGAR